MKIPPKYSQPEIERRWLVDLQAVGDLPAQSRPVEDRYVGSSRLRLRKVTGPAGEVERKLGKKYNKTTPRTESVTSLYLITADRGFDGAEIATCCARVWEQRSSAW